MYFIFLFIFIDIMVDKKINSLFRMYVCHTCGSRSLLFYFRISYPDSLTLIKSVCHSFI